MSRRELRLILNGKSAAEPAIRDAVGLLKRRGYPIDVSVTWELGDARRHAREAAHSGTDVVIAGGGDGTIHEIANGILSAQEPVRTAVAVLPLGTANDFARSCGVPLNDPAAALMLAAEGEVHNIDVGRVNERVFVNVATGGFGAEVTTSTPAQMKRVLGSAAYSLMGLVTSLKVHAWHTKVRLDDELHEGRVIVLAVGNARQAGGGYALTPYAYINDGLLDVMMVHDVELSRFGSVLAELGDMRRESNRFVTYRQVERIHLETEESLQLNLDGEPLRGKRFDFEVVPGRLPFVIPPQAAILQEDGPATPQRT